MEKAKSKDSQIGNAEVTIKETKVNEENKQEKENAEKELERMESLFAPLRKIVHLTVEDAIRDPNKILELLDADAVSRPETRGSYGVKDEEVPAPILPTTPSQESRPVSGLSQKQIEENRPNENKEEAAEINENKSSSHLDIRTLGLEKSGSKGSRLEKASSKEQTLKVSPSKLVKSTSEEPKLEKQPSQRNNNEEVLLDLNKVEAISSIETKQVEEALPNSGGRSYRSPAESSPRKDIQFVTKDKLIKLVQEAKREQENLTLESRRYQGAISRYFSSPQGDELIAQYDKTSITSERVSKTFQEVEAIVVGVKAMQDYYNTTLGDMKARLQEKEAKAKDVLESFIEFKREIAKAAINSKTAKSISLKSIYQIEEEERKVDQELEKVRLKNITLRKHLAHLEKELRQKEEVKNGIHLIDFEQLKIENQTFTEKIEERNEGRNGSLKDHLKSIEEGVIHQRDLVATIKRERDLLRAENVELKQQSGLIGNDDLLRDFEKRRNDSVTVREKLQSLQTTHAVLTEKIANLKTLKSQTMTLSST